MRSIEEKLSKARSFVIFNDESELYCGDIYVEKTNNTPEKWVIRDERRNVLNKEGKWVYEPLPSNRSDEFLEITRFESLDEAWDFFEKCRGIKNEK